MAVGSVETADYYKDKNPKLFGGLGRMSGGNYSIQLREDAVPFALSMPRRVSIPLMDQDVVKRELQRMEGLQVIRRVDTPTDWCAGMVVVAKPRVVASTVEGEEKETHNVRICVDLTKLNDSVMREKNIIYKLSVGWREQRCSQSWMPTPGFSKFPGANIARTNDLHNSLWQILLLTFAIWDKSSPKHFQKRMHKVLEDRPGVICMMDDIIIVGEPLEEHDARVGAVVWKTAALH